MKTEQILNLDYRKEESQEIIQKVLRKIKPLSKYSDESNVPIEAIEKLIRILVQKYEIMPQWMTMSYFEPTLGIYSIGVKTTTEYKLLGTVYGMCLYEVFAKLAIKMYSEVKSGKIPVRTATKEEKERERLAKKADAKMAEVDEEEDWSKEEEPLRTRIFTDGACSENPGPGGWAAVFNTASKCLTISGNEKMTTNNRMELKAVIEAFKKVLSKNLSDAEYELYSDSAYVVNSINNGWIDKWQQNNWKTTKNDDVKNRDLWEELAFLRNKTKSLGIYIKIIKIKGHAGNTFNELVDKLAKEESFKAKEGVEYD